MSFPSSLLRLLLCLALAFNGVSTARAGMHLAHGAASGGGEPAASGAMEDMAGMPCHDMGQGDDPVPSKAHAASEPAAHGAGTDGASMPDCCKSGCQCACMHATSAIAGVAFPAFVVHAAVQRRGTTAHAPPTAPRLNRPPIG